MIVWRDWFLVVLGGVLHGGGVIVAVNIMLSAFVNGGAIAAPAWAAFGCLVVGLIGCGIWMGADDRIKARKGKVSP